jgi:hypothetical protein
MSIICALNEVSGNVKDLSSIFCVRAETLKSDVAAFYVKRRNPNWLCKLGLHKWRNYGESVVVTWKEPASKAGPIPTTNSLRLRFRTQSREVFTKKKCLRCGISMKRRLVKNADGTLSCIGWDPISESEYEKDEHAEPQRKSRHARMIH